MATDAPRRYVMAPQLRIATWDTKSCPFVMRAPWTYSLNKDTNKESFYRLVDLMSIQKDLAAICTAAMKGVELNKRLFGAAEDCRREIGISPSIVQSTTHPRQIG